MSRHATTTPRTARVAPFERDPQRGSLRKAAVSGTKWSIVQYGGSRVVTVVVFVALSHLLLPSEFGVVALANVFIALLGIFVNAGMGQAIIQRKDLNDSHVDSVFWLSLATSVVLAGLLVGTAGLISQAVGEPQLAPVLRVLSIGLVFSSLAICHNMLLKRALRFKTVAVRTLVATVASSIVGLACAFAGAGAWALVAQYLVFTGVQTVLLWALSGWRPGLDVSMGALRDVFGFSNSSLIQSILTFLGARSDDFLIGAWLGARALGFYSVGYRLLSVISDLVGSTLSSVAFPVFSRMQHDPAGLRRAYVKVVGFGARLSFPGYLIFVVIAGDTTRVLFGPQWGPAVRVMQLLAVFGAIQVSLSTCDAVLNATGRPHLVWRYRLANVVVQVGGFALAAPYGINWVAFTLVARAYLMLPLPVWFLRRAGVVGYRQFFGALAAPAVGSAAMVAVLEVLYRFVMTDFAPVLRLVVACVVGAATYLAVMLVIDRRGMREMLGLVRGPRARGGRPGVPAGAAASQVDRRGSETTGAAGAAPGPVAGRVGGPGRHALSENQPR